MNKNLENKIVVVTGGSQGIGRGICECFLQAGACVVVADLRPPADLVEWQARCEEMICWLEVDVASVASIKTMTEVVGQRFRGVDVLINNAGIMFEKSIDEQTESDWDILMSVNLKGPAMMTKYLLPAMRKKVKQNGCGAIVNIGSVEGYSCNPNHTAYAASKGGVHGLTAALAVDLGPQGIRVNAIAPGWIDTDLNRQYIESVNDAELAKRELRKLHPIGYIGDCKDIGDVAVWLAGSDSRFVSGQVVTVDGARTKRLSLPQIFNQ